MTPAPSSCAELRRDAGARCEVCGDAPAARARHRVAGKVRDLQSRADTHWFTKSPETVLTFRVAQFDDQGNVARLSSAEIRGSSLSGMLHDNDEVCVSGRSMREVLRAQRVQNLTDGSLVVAGGMPRVVLALAVVLLVLIAVFILYVFIRIFAG